MYRSKEAYQEKDCMGMAIKNCVVVLATGDDKNKGEDEDIGDIGVHRVGQ